MFEQEVFEKKRKYKPEHLQFVIEADLWRHHASSSTQHVEADVILGTFYIPAGFIWRGHGQEAINPPPDQSLVLIRFNHSHVRLGGVLGGPNKKELWRYQWSEKTEEMLTNRLLKPVHHVLWWTSSHDGYAALVGTDHDILSHLTALNWNRTNFNKHHCDQNRPGGGVLLN